MVSPAESSPNTGGPNSSAMSSKPRLSEEEIGVARYTAAGLVLASGILALYSIFSYWWLISGFPTGTGVAFFPGASLRNNGTFSTYASAGLGPVGGVYEAILVLAIVAGVLAIVGGALALLMTARHRKPQNMRIGGLILAGVVIEGITVAIAPAMTPWALNDSGGTPSFCSGWTEGSPCSSFWGTGTYGGAGLTFVGADGWIIMIGALALGVLGVVIWALGRNPKA